MKNVLVEITSRCNLSCPMCMRHSWKDAEGDMDITLFRHLISSCSTLQSLNLSGYGEPFLHPRLLDIIRTARKAHPFPFCIGLVSNGTLIDRAAAKDMLEAGLNRITLSMDSLDEDRFRDIRGGASLKEVTRCLEEVMNAREARADDSFVVDLSFVAMDRNIGELPDLVRFAADARIHAIWVNNVLPYTEAIAGEILYDRSSEYVCELFDKAMEELRALGRSDTMIRTMIRGLVSMRTDSVGHPDERTADLGERLLLQLARDLASVDISMGNVYDIMLKMLERDAEQHARYSTVFDQARTIAERHSVELHLPLLVPKTKRECDFIRNETCFVTWDGWVRPCNQLSHDYGCFHSGRPKTVNSVSFGKIPHHDVEVIWNSHAYMEFRQNVMAFPFSPCGDCGLADGCGYIDPEGDFCWDCTMCEQPCGDCLWSRGILQCP